jgi:hypothetical protein
MSAGHVERARGHCKGFKTAIYRAEGESVAPAEDFRGRHGHVISVSERVDATAGVAASALRAC